MEKSDESAPTPPDPSKPSDTSAPRHPLAALDAALKVKSSRQTLRQLSDDFGAAHWKWRGLAIILLTKYPTEKLKELSAEQFEELEKKVKRGPKKRALLADLSRHIYEQTVDEIEPRLILFLRDQILPQLSWPRPFTLHELSRAIIRHVFAQEEFDDGITDLFEALERRVRRYRFRSSPFRVATVEGPCNISATERSLWKTPTAELSIARVSSTHGWRMGKSGSMEPRVTSDVMVSLTGRLSAAAGTQAAREARELLRTIFVCAADMARPGEFVGGAPGRPRLKPSDVTSHGKLVRRVLDVYSVTPTGKDSVHRRVRNALELMVASNAQTNPALGLSMSCSALEALVCRGSDNITRSLSDNLAILLEPEREHRRSAAQFVKGLYEVRSKTLHGAKMEARPEQRAQARALAAHALAAFLEWEDCQVRMLGQRPTPEAFFEEIENVRLPGRPLMHGFASKIRAFWNVTA